MKSHKDLDAWNRAVDLVNEIYRVTFEFPSEEKFNLVNQIRRSAVSIPSNIAEGAARNHKKEYIQFLYVALGSIAELETQIIISENLGFISSEKTFKIKNELIEIKNMILGLIRFLRNKKS